MGVRLFTFFIYLRSPTHGGATRLRMWKRRLGAAAVALTSWGCFFCHLAAHDTRGERLGH